MRYKFRNLKKDIWIRGYKFGDLRKKSELWDKKKLKIRNEKVTIARYKLTSFTILSLHFTIQNFFSGFPRIATFNVTFFAVYISFIILLEYDWISGHLFISTHGQSQLNMNEQRCLCVCMCVLLLVICLCLVSSLILGHMAIVQSFHCISKDIYAGHRLASP